MDTQRLILLVIFSFSVLMLWEAWQKEQRGPQPAVTKPAADAAPGAAVPTPGAAGQTSPAPATAAAPAATSAASPATGTVPANTGEAPTRERTRITASTELMTVQIDPLGGDIVRIELHKHKDARDPNKNYVLIAPEHRYSAQSGFTAAQLPNHKTLYQTERSEYVLGAGDAKLDIKLEAVTAEGLRATKTLVLHRDSYTIDVIHEVVNSSAAPIASKAYFHLTRDNKAPAEDQAMLQTFTGPAVYTDQVKYQKLSWSDIDKNKSALPAGVHSEGWVAMVQHYFVAALVPSTGAKREFYANRIEDNFYRAGLLVDVGIIAPQETGRAVVRLYAGPQEQEKLSALASGLDLVVDYGFLTVIAAPLFWLLRLFHDGVTVGGVRIPGAGNWGWAIVLLTILVKLVFFPLSAASYRSMAKMKLVTPRLMKLREQYGDDRAKLNQAMMELYKKEKINPLGGCLPILVQIPVFIALYWVLLGSVELRQAPFMGWIRDLSAPDPWYVLPVIMMASMFLQTKMSPPPPDPVQAKVMMMMPLIFGVMFFWFPAGLVLYWVVNNVLSIAQQWQIQRMFTDPSKASAAKS